MSAGLIAYIKRQRKKGYSRAQIRNVLLEAGYQESVVDRAFHMHDNLYFAIIMGLVAIILIVVAIPEKEEVDTSIDDVVNEYTEQCFRLEECERTLVLADDVLRVDETNPQSLLYKGLAYYQLGRYDDAIRSFEKAQKYASGSFVKAQIFEGFGWAYYRLGDPRCVHNFQQAINLGNKQFWGLGWCYHSLGQYEDALVAYNTGLQNTDIDKTYLRVGKGHAYYQLGRYEEAIDAFESATGSSLTRYRLEAYENLVKIYSEKDNPRAEYYQKKLLEEING
ncbi:MAG: tetratricopeptide repeat protein [Nanobdellota archaeon]